MKTVAREKREDRVSSSDPPFFKDDKLISNILYFHTYKSKSKTIFSAIPYKNYL